MELKKNWNSNGNIAGGDRFQLLGFCLGQTDSTANVIKYHRLAPSNVPRSPRCATVHVCTTYYVQYYLTVANTNTDSRQYYIHV